MTAAEQTNDRWFVEGGLFCLPDSKALALLGTIGVTSDVVEALGLPASPDLRDSVDSLFFIVEGVLNGRNVRILCDTGASISFVANHFVKKFGFDVCTLSQEEKGLTVRLERS